MKKSKKVSVVSTIVKRSAARPENAWAVVWKNDGGVSARPNEILVVDVQEEGRPIKR
jgi:hypothetical protein